MSGGAFNYNQHRINDIIIEIEERLAAEIFTVPSEVRQAIIEGVYALKIAEIYAQRIDWFFSGDDGEVTFLNRLEKELKEVE